MYPTLASAVRPETHQPDLHHLRDGPHALLSSLSADILLLSAGFPAVLLLYILDPNLKMLDFHAHPLESKKHETKNQHAKSGQGMPVRTHDCCPRTPVVVPATIKH